MAEISSIVLIHYEAGETIPNVHIIGGEEVRVFWVDDNAPGDRVFEQTSRADASIFRELIPDGSEIGSAHDQRHAAIENKINALLDGRAPFTVLDGGKDNG